MRFIQLAPNLGSAFCTLSILFMRFLIRIVINMEKKLKSLSILFMRFAFNRRINNWISIYTFNSLYEIPFFHGRHRFCPTSFNSLYEILSGWPCLLTWFCPFNSLYEIRSLSVIPSHGVMRDFQFSLWDSQLMHQCRTFLILHPFNSLYEILYTNF